MNEINNILESGWFAVAEFIGFLAFLVWLARRTK